MTRLCTTSREAEALAMMAAALARATAGSVTIGEYDPRVQPVHCKRIAAFRAARPAPAYADRCSALHRLPRRALGRRSVARAPACRRASSAARWTARGVCLPDRCSARTVAATARARPSSGSLHSADHRRRSRVRGADRSHRGPRVTPRALRAIVGARLRVERRSLAFACASAAIVGFVQPHGVATITDPLTADVATRSVWLAGPMFFCSTIGIAIALSQGPGRHAFLDTSERSAPLVWPRTRARKGTDARFFPPHSPHLSTGPRNF